MTRILVALMVAMIVVASPAAATFVPGAVAPETNGQPELVMTGTGPGRSSVFGGLAPSQFDPLNGYPASPPNGSVPKHVDFAGLITASPIPPGPGLLLYCIDISTPTSAGVKYQLGTWNAATVPNVGYVARLLNTYYPNTNLPTSLSSANDKAAAVQAAIWFFSDKYVLNASQPRRADVAAIVQNVINLGPIVNPSPPSLTVTPASADGPAGSMIGPFTLDTTSPATVTATGGDLFLDAAGTQPLTNPVANGAQFWARRATAGDVAIQATAIATVPSGNVYLPIRQVAQKLILAQTGTLQTKVNATATAFDVGNLRVVKTVSGPGEPQRSAVSVSASCTDGSSGAAIYPTGSPPTPLVVQNIRGGSLCTVLELVDGANDFVSVTTTFAPGSVVTIPTNTTTTDTTRVDVSNVYEVRTGSLRVTKVVTGADAGLRGDVVIDVACSNGTNASFTFPAGETPTPQTVSDLPAGTTCTTTEPTDGGSPPTVVVSTTIAPPGPVSISAGETAEVVVSNLYDPGIGSLVVMKDTEGLDELRDSITIRAVCDDGSTGEQNYPVNAPLTPLVLDNLPIGTQCTVTEPVTGESSLVNVATSIDPAATVTITAPQPPVVVRVVNTYTAKPGTVTVHKSITGEGAALHGRVVVVVACEDGQLARIDIPAGASGPRTATLNGVPAGDDCGVAELATGANATVKVRVTGLPDGLFVLLPAEDRTISIVDDYRWNPGALLVTKVIDGPVAARRGAISLTIGCSNGAQVSRTFDPGVTPTPILIQDLPAGTVCSLTEPGNGAGSGVGDVTIGAPQSITIAPGGVSAAVVRNTFVEVEVLAAETTNGGLAKTGTDALRLGGLGLLLLALGATLMVATLKVRRRPS